MTSSNRVMNRMLLALVGLLFAAASVLVAWPLVTGTARPFTLPAADDTAATAVLLGGAVVVVALSVTWIVTRGRGRRSLAIETTGLRLDTTAVESVVRDELQNHPDIVAARVQAYRSRDGRTLLLSVQARTHADLLALTDGVRAAIARADATLGVALPIVVHITTGLRTAMASSRSTH
jgi:hypothetical protein